MRSDKLDTLLNKHILILGYGREGISTHRFLRKYFPNKKIYIADKKHVSTDDPGASIICGEKYLDNLTNFELVFRTPGVSPRLPEIVNALESGVEFTSQTQLFFDLCGGTVIGVTGTKGKSTTTSLIGKILSDVGMDVEVVGNIGRPCLDYLDENWGSGKYFAFELSSHQLSDVKISPQVAIFLNIFREHLDYYDSYHDYFQAKARITKYQAEGDLFVYNFDFGEIVDLAKQTNARTKSFSLQEKRGDCYYSQDKVILRDSGGGHELIDCSDIKLMGVHNINNVMAASLVGQWFGVSTASLRKSISSFEPLADRLDFVGKFGNIEFYCDALATIPEATVAAIDVFAGRLGGLIVGGLDRSGLDFSALAKRILEENLDIVVLFPETGGKIYKEMARITKNLPKCENVRTMAEAVKLCYSFVGKGKVCLLSSASPSFNLFEDYRDKSRQFRESILKEENMCVFG